MASIQKIKSPLTGEISYRVQVRVKGRPSESETFIAACCSVLPLLVQPRPQRLPSVG